MVFLSIFREGVVFEPKPWKGMMLRIWGTMNVSGKVRDMKPSKGMVFGKFWIVKLYSLSRDPTKLDVTVTSIRGIRAPIFVRQRRKSFIPCGELKIIKSITNLIIFKNELFHYWMFLVYKD